MVYLEIFCKEKLESKYHNEIIFSGLGWCYFIGNIFISLGDTSFYIEGSSQKCLPDTFEKLTYNFLLVSPMGNAYFYEICSLYIEYKSHLEK